MPITKAAQKQMRVDERRRQRNKSARSLTKTNVGKAETLIASGKLETAEEVTKVAITSLDKAAEKGVIHPNKAARTKSRLMKKLNKAQSTATKDKPKA